MTERSLICLSLLLNGLLWKKLPSTISFLERQALPRVVLSTMFVKPIPSSKSFLSSSELMGRGNKPDKNMHFPAFLKKKMFQKKLVHNGKKVKKIKDFQTEIGSIFIVSERISITFFFCQIFWFRYLFFLSFVTFSTDFSPFSCMSFNYRNLC